MAPVPPAGVPNAWGAAAPVAGCSAYFDWRSVTSVLAASASSASSTRGSARSATRSGFSPAALAAARTWTRRSAFVARSAAAGQPFFLYVAPFAPHAPATPAPRHAEAFPDPAAPRVPSFGEADVGDKPAWVRDQVEIGPDEAALIDAHHGLRMRSLLAVDDLVATVMDALSASGALEDTYVFFTSDNGFHLGEHRIGYGKRTPYEEAIRVPLLVRGPGVPAGRVVEELALNVDLAPTFAELAGVAAPDFVDGRSLVPLLRGDQRLAVWR